MIASTRVGTGPYDELYEASPTPLWTTPGRLVLRAAEWLAPGASVYDAGCGDGKNALELIRRSYRVSGCDVSSAAIQRLRHRFADVGRDSTAFEVADIHSVTPQADVDCLLSYGLFHCLPPADRGWQHAQLIRRVARGGHVLFCSLLDSRPMPVDHHTPEVILPAYVEVERLFNGLDVLHLERATIAETHPPLVGLHQHDGIWIVARRR